MSDNIPEEPSPAAIARRLEGIAVELHDLEVHLPTPLSLAGARHELTLTADVCRRLADGPMETETADDQPDASTDASEEMPGGQ